MASTWDIVKDVLDFGGSAYNTYERNQARGDYGDAIRQREQYNYDQGKLQYDAYVDWAKRADQVAASNAAGRAAAAAARAAAARQQEMNRQRARRRADRADHKFYEQALGYLQPYVDAGNTLLPQATAAYSQGLSGAQLLASYLMQPGSLQRQDQSVPATSINLGLPKELRGAQK